MTKDPPTDTLASRRDFAKKAAAGVAGLAAVGVAGAVAAAAPASAVDTSAGQLFLVNPGRVYDSRFDPAQKLAFAGIQGERVVTCTTVIVGMPGAGTVIVPSGATAILCNLTVTATESAGFLGLFSNALAVWPGTSSINWVAANVDLANAVTCAIDATGTIKVVIAGNQGAKAHFIIDVMGYYLPVV